MKIFSKKYQNIRRLKNMGGNAMKSPKIYIKELDIRFLVKKLGKTHDKKSDDL